MSISGSRKASRSRKRSRSRKKRGASSSSSKSRSKNAKKEIKKKLSRSRSKSRGRRKNCSSSSSRGRRKSRSRSKSRRSKSREAPKGFSAPAPAPASGPCVGVRPPAGATGFVAGAGANHASDGGLGALFGADDDEDEEVVDIMDVRAQQRRDQAGSMQNLDDLPVQITPDDLPPPISAWDDAVARGYLNAELHAKITSAGLERPTLIQRHCLPIVSHKFGYYDMIASAQTGSGKTFAFVIPTVARLLMQGAIPRPFFAGAMAQSCPLVLLLSPTRELANQTAKEVEVLVSGTNLTHAVIYGGESIKLQAKNLSDTNCDILCSTPGRLLDLQNLSKVSLSYVQTVVLDEADQMLDLGLEPMCAEILRERDLPPTEHRQTLLFSATMPQKIRDLTGMILRQGERLTNVKIGHYGDDQGGSCKHIRQVIKWVDEVQRSTALMMDLQQLWIQPGMVTGKKGKVVIFTNRRMQAAQLSSRLQGMGIMCLHLHGKLEQAVREDVVDKFRRGFADVLVATNLVARGLDFPDIALVVQYDMPQSVETYTHRIGRTGRVGQVGCALSYMSWKDRHLGEKLVEFLDLNGQECPPFLLEYKKAPPPSQDRGRDRDQDRDRVSRFDQKSPRSGHERHDDRGGATAAARGSLGAARPCMAGKGGGQHWQGAAPGMAANWHSKGGSGQLHDVAQGMAGNGAYDPFYGGSAGSSTGGRPMPQGSLGQQLRR